MKLSRLIVWVAFGWAIVCAALILALAASTSWIWGIPTAGIGLAAIGVSAWLFFRGGGWIVAAVVLPFYPLGLISTAANPGAVFLLSNLLIIIAAVVRLFEVEGAKLRAGGGRA